MFNDVILSPSLRGNLLQLDHVKGGLAEATLNLGTGKRVHSAAQSPYEYFTAGALNSRASALLDMTNELELAIKATKAADQGLTTITKLLRSAKAKAYQAQQTTSISKRASYARDYNELLEQIGNVARDSNYNGKNLLGGGKINNLKVSFNVDGTSNIIIKSIDYTDTTEQSGLNLDQLALAKPKDDAKITIVPGALPGGGAAAATVTAGSTLTSLGAVEGDSFTFKVTLADGSTQSNTLVVDSDTTVSEMTTFIRSNVNGVTPEYSTGANIGIKSYLQLDIIAAKTNTGTLALGTSIVAAGDVAASGFESSTDISTVLANINTSLGDVEAQAARFGSQLGVLDARKNFNKAIANTLEAGADQLTQANVSREAAKTQALRVSENLIYAATGMTIQGMQGVLRLF